MNRLFVCVVALLFILPSPLRGEGRVRGSITPSPLRGEGRVRGSITPSPLRGEGRGEGEIARLDKTGWFDCISKEECTKLSDRFRSRLKKGHNPEDAFGAALSALLAEYLRKDGEPIDLSAVEEANNLMNSNGYSSAKKLVNGLIDLVMGDATGARELVTTMHEGERDTISASLLLAFSYEEDRAEFDNYAAKVLKDKFIPPLAFKLGAGLLMKGQCRPAQRYFGELIKRYKRNGDVVSMWAASMMGCGQYPKKIYGKLLRIYKNNPEDYNILAQMVRYLNHESDLDKIKNLVSEIDIALLKGEAGSELLTELAGYKLKNRDIAAAQAMLNRAVILNPKNAAAHRLLGKLYLVGKKNLPKAIASLKNYIHLAAGDPGIDRVKILVSELEGETGFLQ